MTETDLSVLGDDYVHVPSSERLNGPPRSD